MTESSTVLVLCHEIVNLVRYVYSISVMCV